MHNPPALLIIRPANRIPADATLCRRTGWQPVPFPLIHIRPEANALAGLPAQLQQAAAAVWISPTAVETALPLLAGSHSATNTGLPENEPSSLLPNIKPNPPIFSGSLIASLPQPQIAVGSGTAKALRQAGFAHVVAPDGGHDSEAVLALPLWRTLNPGANILIVRGAHGRNLLPESLCQHGFQVACADIYQRRPLAPDWALFAAAQPAAVWITSAEQVRLLFAAAPASLTQRLQSLLYFAHHPRIAEALSQAGAARIRLLRSAAGLENALIAERQHLTQAT